MKRKAVVLLSGGLDSAVTLFWAVARGYECHCLTFDYGQRHNREIESAKRIANAAKAGIEVVKLDFPWKGSSLTDRSIDLPSGRTAKDIQSGGIPSTYVPARNTIFLSIAASFAEAICADSILIGAHFEDSSGYPDCRKSYLEAFRGVIESGTIRGSSGRLLLEFPLIEKSKSEIIMLGRSVGAPFALTWSCYKGGELPCGSCDSCVLRLKGFREAGMEDPLLNPEDLFARNKRGQTPFEGV
ncbi:MAG: 7-cyano-7-deazaguanine synthase QueC [Candidatus Omnitrophota bacterium]|nr:7-cyano-7-deazaguanine synthase QueC [Candidatus Omnitrophota bacterium]